MDLPSKLSDFTRRSSRSSPCRSTRSSLVTVSVKKLDVTDRGEVMAICHRGRERTSIPLVDLELPEPPPRGWEWIHAYRRWARGAL